MIGNEESIRCGSIICRDLNFLSIPGIREGDRLDCTVKIRYHHAGQPASIEPIGDDLVKVSFKTPVRAAAPGQSAVFYDDEDRVIGGGIISDTL